MSKMGAGENSDIRVAPGEAPAEREGSKKMFLKYSNSVLGTSLSDENLSPVEQVNLTVPITDDPSKPVWTFRMWFLGLLSCIVLGFLNQFFNYRTEPLTISSSTAQIIALPLGRIMAATLPTRVFFKGSRLAFSLNPGPFNIKEHVLITIFANAGAGGAYAINIVTIVKAFYKQNISFSASLLITITTQIIGYGWAGIFRNFLVKPGVMWWPATLVQVSLFRTLHEPDRRSKGGVTRLQFFLLGMTCSFGWYLLPGYFYKMLSSLSWVCWAFPNSVLAHQLGSGMSGLGIGAIGMDWSVVSSYLQTPLATPWFAIANVGVGFFIFMYVITPIAYWNNVYSARSFPIFSFDLFRSNGQSYNVEEVISDTFSLDIAKYEAYGKVHLSTYFALTYGVAFTAFTATLSHVALFHGKDLWRISTQAVKGKEDVHTRLMRAYREVPQWWFHLLLMLMIALAIIATEVYKSQLQLPWWGILLACALAFCFTLPSGIIAATTNQVPALYIVTEYIFGYVYPGRPVASLSFKTYGSISMLQAVRFLQDFKLGHYMKIPPISMFVVQLVGAVVASLVYLITAWWLLTTIENICDIALLPANSPWTCPQDRLNYDASVIWGLVGPKRIYGSLYKQINWGFAVGAIAPIPVWVATKIWPNVKFVRLINMPILLGYHPPPTAVNYISWLIVGFIFNFVIFRYRKAWWSRYNYVLSASLDAGVAFMGVALYLVLQYEHIGISWWGNANLPDNCPLARCPTQPGLGQPNPHCPAT